ncbi:polysaccharide biosynthesis/export family protein [Mesobacterium pallidum]|uniref:polysaccharide biosynthesis/export family protein n=1 Tax=Mesobacterium pallidum TaxID=2872037 RepID=UPI001EE22874|nr:polysaccharide biosynthesis/export family protein [Mesobacterium pallidum]
MAFTLVSACTLPRGAALRSEIVKESEQEDPTFAVVPVTRATVPYVAKWPVTGWSGSYHWIGATRAPKSNIIAAGDTIDLVIWDNQENSLITPTDAKAVTMNGLRVSANGTIFVPYVYDVVVRGLTPDEARERIQSQLEPIVPSAQVQLSATSGQDNSVDLVGGVNAPGSFPMPSRDFSILSLIALGGGISPNIENPLVRLQRSGTTYAIRAESLFENASNNTTLRGGDKVIVEDDTRTFMALGATGTESLITFPKEHITAMEALSLIGGISDNRANPKGILILREYSPRHLRADGLNGPSRQQVIFTLDLTTADGLFAARNLAVNPDDTVLATESPVTTVRTIAELFGTFVGFGTTVNNASSSGGN